MKAGCLMPNKKNVAAPGAATATVGPFYLINGKITAHAVSLEAAEDYGDFKTCPYSHNDFWHERLKGDMPYDFDYFPRGRVVFNKKNGVFTVYTDVCFGLPVSADLAERIRREFGLPPDTCCEFRLDEHYQCHKCNEHYVL